MRIYQLLICLIVVLSSCDQNEEQQFRHEHLEEAKNFRFCLTQSYATQENYFEPGDVIGIFVTNHNNITEIYRSNVKYVFDGTYFNAATSVDEIINNGQELDFFAYYPYSESVNDLRSIPYAVGSQETLDERQRADFLTAINKTGIAAGDVNLPFRHKYATVIFNVEDIPNIDYCELVDVYTNSKYDFSSDIASPEGSLNNILMLDRGKSNGIRTFEVTLPVQSITTGKNVFELKKSSGSDIKCQISGSKSLIEGQISTFGIKLVKTITIGTYDPKMGTATGGGRYEFEQICVLEATPKTPGYHFVEWIENSTQIYTDGKYEFTVLTDRTLTPVFQNDTTWSEWDFTLSATPTSIGRDGGSSTITTNCTREVYVKGVFLETEISTPVLSINNPAFTLTDNIVSIGSNPINSEARTVIVTATTKEGLTKSLLITQAKGIVESYTYTYEFSLSPGSHSFGKDGGSYTFSVGCNYVIRKYHDGVLINTDSSPYSSYSTSVSGTGFSRSGNTVYAAANPGAARSGTFTASAGSNSASASLYQEKGIIVTTSTGYEISISPSSYQFGENGGSYTFSVTCNSCVYTYHDGVLVSTSRTPYTGYSRSISGAGFSYSGNTVTASANSGSARSGTFTVSAGGKSASASLSQKGKIDIGTGIQ